MNLADLPELHYITSSANVPSILVKGILCHRSADSLEHTSVAMAEIQERRVEKTVPGGKPLHDYANLYICARNPMLYKRKDMHKDLSVLRVNTSVLNLRGVVIADGNASSGYTGFWSSPAGLDKVDKDLVFAEFWTDADQIVEWRKKRVKCAEVLVPDRVDPRFILGAYVSCDESKHALETVVPSLSITVDAHLFFI
jgi:ssDNA thymidine ADP-ribosyltransferase, DarT